LLQINNFLQYRAINALKNTKRTFTINNLLNKYTLSNLLVILLSGCDHDTYQQGVNVPFQCLSSQSVCEVDTKLGKVLVNFNSEKVLTELPFKILVEFKNNTLKNNKDRSQDLFKIEGYMEGRTMFMGKIPLFFTESVGSPQSYIAETMLGSCSEDVMTWRLWLTIEIQAVNGQAEQTSFFVDFNSTRF